MQFWSERLRRRNAWELTDAQGEVYEITGGGEGVPVPVPPPSRNVPDRQPDEQAKIVEIHQEEDPVTKGPGLKESAHAKMPRGDGYGNRGKGLRRGFLSNGL